MVGNPSVRDYGAVGDGATDDTQAIDRALRDNPGCTVDVPAGTYLVDGNAQQGDDWSCAILLDAPGTGLRLDREARVVMGDSGATDHACIVQVVAADCTITGGLFVGDLRVHSGTTGEWSHGIAAGAGGDRFCATGVQVAECWGDGFNVHGADDVRLVDCVSSANRRQGLSITAGARTQVVGGSYVDTGTIAATPPTYGIDVEPNPGRYDVVDVRIEGATMAGNVGGGLALVSTTGVRTTGRSVGCTMTDNRGPAIWASVNGEPGEFAWRSEGSRCSGNAAGAQIDPRCRVTGDDVDAG